MKRAEIQSKVKEGLKALNIIGIDQGILEKAKAEIQSIPPDSIPPEGIPYDGTLDRAKVNIASNFCKVDMDVLDKALSTMDVYEQAVYNQLYRCSYGNQQNWCTIGYGRLAKRCNMTRGGIINTLIRLGANGWVDTIEQTTRGTTYRVYLPQENGIESETQIQSIPLNSIPSHSIPPDGIPSDDTPAIPLKSIPSNGTPGRKPASDKEPSASVPPNGIPPGGPNIDLDHNIDLSPDHIIDLFYRGLGQKRVTKEKRERARIVFEELQEEGFTGDDIHFAVEWILKPGNAKEKPYDFSILNHTIGQAYAEQEAARATQKAEAGENAAREEERRSQAKFEKQKSEMSEQERADLRQRAEDEIRKTEGIKEQFISEPLIIAKENEILGRNGS